MSINVGRLRRMSPLVCALILFAIQFAAASTAPVVSGSYAVVQNQNLGAHVQVRMHIHLVNDGPSDFSVQRITLWDFSHPEKGASRACSITLHAHASADMVEEFLVSRSDYQRWQKGSRPRFVLQMSHSANSSAGQANRSTVAVRLARSSEQEAK